MSSPPWQDRRGMFQRGKEVHESSSPVQAVRKSISGGKAEAPKTESPPTKTTPSATTAATASPTEGVTAAGRRRSSASSQGGMFGGLMANRSGPEQTQRRQSWDDMKKPEGGLGGFLSNLVNNSKK